MLLIFRTFYFLYVNLLSADNGISHANYGDSLDWKDYGVDSIIKEVVNNKHLGKDSIILMHNGARDTPEAPESIIKGLQDKNYRIVPISQLIFQVEYTIDHEGRQFGK